MKAKELFDEFLTYCTDYELELGNAVIKNNDNKFTVFSPKENVDYLVYQICLDYGREQGYSSDINELLKLAIDTVGNEKIKIEEKTKSYY